MLSNDALLTAARHTRQQSSLGAYVRTQGTCRAGAAPARVQL